MKIRCLIPSVDRRALLFVVGMVMGTAEAGAQEILLFGGPGNDEYMGSLTGRFDSDSVCNRFGKFGSRIYQKVEVPYEFIR